MSKVKLIRSSSGPGKFPRDLFEPLRVPTATVPSLYGSGFFCLSVCLCDTITDVRDPKYQSLWV